MSELAVLADDLTGAADAAGGFALAGLATAVIFGDGEGADCDVVVRSAETRECDIITARSRASETALRLAGDPSRRPHLIYSKLDSALRGYPCEQLMAVMRATGDTIALVAPALPSQGRTTVGGHQYIRGVPLAGTDLGAEAGTSDLVSLFRCQPGYAVHAVPLATVREGAGSVARRIAECQSGVIVADAETDADLRAVAEGALNAGVTHLAGSAGLASQLAGMVASSRARAPLLRPPRVTGPVLLVAGSRHPATAAQVDTLVSRGIPVVHLSFDVLSGNPKAVSGCIAEVCTALSSNGNAALATIELSDRAIAPERVASTLEELVARIAAKQPPAALILTGGDVAASVLARLGASRFSIGGEVVPQVPWGILRSDLLGELPLVTKAGSFGDADTLAACIAFMRS